MQNTYWDIRISGLPLHGILQLTRMIIHETHTMYHVHCMYSTSKHTMETGFAKANRTQLLSS